MEIEESDYIGLVGVAIYAFYVYTKYDSAQLLAGVCWLVWSIIILKGCLKS